MREVVYTHRADMDLREIWTFTANRWNTDQADTYIGQILASCNSLASGMVLGRDASDIGSGYRKQPAGSHVIYFKEFPAGIVIIRILHERMDVSSHFED